MPCPRCYHRLDPAIGAVHPSCEDTPDAVRIRVLAAADPTGPRQGEDQDHSCPLCGTATDPYADGRRALCLRCTEAELGQTVADIRTRINEQRTKQRKWRVTS